MIADAHDASLNELDADLNAYTLPVADRLKLRALVLIGRILVSILVRMR
jgi:hypothetical protein